MKVKASIKPRGGTGGYFVSRRNRLGKKRFYFRNKRKRKFNQRQG